MKTITKNLLKDVRGNVAMMFGLSLMATMIAVGAAYDYSNIASAKRTLQDIADSGALAGAAVARTKGVQRQKVARQDIDNNMITRGDFSLNGDPSIVFDDAAAEIAVTINSSVKTIFGSMFGLKDVRVGVTSKTGYGIEKMSPLSVAMALDVSGSMSWDGPTPPAGTVLPEAQKITALKTAVGAMFQTLYDKSENPSLLVSTIRTGYGAYNTALAEREPMRAGYSATVNDIDDLVAGGGTNSTPAFQYAYDQLLADS